VLRSNYSVVAVYCASKSVSIHHVLRSNQYSDAAKGWLAKFQYTTCYGQINNNNCCCSWLILVSIHHVLRSNR